MSTVDDMRAELKVIRAQLGHAQAVRQFAELLDDDALAVSCQTLGQYRLVLLTRLASLTFTEQPSNRGAA